MLHVWWHQVYCDILRSTIPGFREGLAANDLAQLPQDDVSSWRRKCLSHAVSVAEILQLASQNEIDVITDPSLAVCAFHSARIISRLAHPPMGTMSQPDLVSKLEGCFAALKKQAEVYPRTRILREGILELLLDAQKAPYGSIWNTEHYKQVETPKPVHNLTPGSHTHEVFRFSVRDEICSSTFEQRGRNQQRESQDCEGSFQRLSASPQDSDRQEDCGTLGGLGSHSSTQPTENEPTSVHRAEFFMHDGRNSRPATSFGDMFNFDFGTSPTDPRYQGVQPDVFMDTFWPVPDVSGFMQQDNIR